MAKPDVANVETVGSVPTASSKRTHLYFLLRQEKDVKTAGENMLRILKQIATIFVIYLCNINEIR